MTLALFDQQGDPIGAGTFTATVIAAGGFISCNGTNTVCTLPAGKSGFFKASPPAGTTDWFGHGTLEWSISGTDSQPVSLTTTGVMTINSLVGANQILFPLEVTKSQPF